MTRLVSPTIPREEDVHGEKKKKKKKKFERGTGYEKRRRRDETRRKRVTRDVCSAFRDAETKVECSCGKDIYIHIRPLTA